MSKDKKTYQWNHFAKPNSMPQYKDMRNNEYLELIRETWDHRRSEETKIKDSKRI